MRGPSNKRARLIRLYVNTITHGANRGGIRAGYAEWGRMNVAEKRGALRSMTRLLMRRMKVLSGREPPAWLRALGEDDQAAQLPQP